jgi:hypothetical protein
MLLSYIRGILSIVRFYWFGANRGAALQFGSILALDGEKCASSPRIFAKYRNRIPMAQYAKGV